MAEFSENRHISNLINMSCKVVNFLGQLPLNYLNKVYTACTCSVSVVLPCVAYRLSTRSKLKVHCCSQR